MSIGKFGGKEGKNRNKSPPNARKLGKNSEMVKKLNTLNAKSLINGESDNLHRFLKVEKSVKKVNHNQEMDSDQEEEMNKCFFEQMVYWQFEDQRRKKSGALVEA